jgi:hypothetical protein
LHPKDFSATKVIAFVCPALIVAAVTALADPSLAQAPRFRVTPLRAIPGMTTDVHGTIGINNKGQVVYGYLHSTGPSLFHAWYWSPITENSLSANTIHLIDNSNTYSSIARDINEDSKIAGVSGGLASEGGKATVWTPASGAFASPDLFGTTHSEAFALSNDSSPHVVGQRWFTETCGISTVVKEGMRWVVGGSTTTLAPISPFNDQFSIATDIRRNGDDIMVGTSEPCNRAGLCEIYIFAGTSWNNSGTGSAADVGDVRESEAGEARSSHPYGVNDDGNMVGWVWYDPMGGSAICFPTATFWESPSDTDPVDLADFINGDRSRAFAINSVANPQVVGENRTSSHAMLWEYDPECSPCWIASDLDDSGNGVIPACSDATWAIIEAHDINDSCWIVAVGDNGSALWALLLTPEPCPTDVTNDGYIDENDLAAVFLRTLITNSCGNAEICVWDVNFDCAVDEDDYDAVFGVIANCESEPCPCEGGDSFTSGDGPSIEDYALALASLEPELTSEQMALAWEWFFEEYYQYN